jgi:PurA ssDNA and RNA-binding protein
MDNVIASQELQVERKHYYIEFRENERGRFLRITEEAHGRRNTVIVPSTGLNEFNAAIDAVVVAANVANGTVVPSAPTATSSPGSPNSASSAA